MIPITLSISGFLSYKDPVEIDFTSFDLACISGQNGAGKSSILDAMTWALFGRARKHDESIINLESDTAQVNLTFEYEGNLYRVMRTNPRGKTTALEFHINQNGAAGNTGSWKPLTESSLRETDQKIVDTLRLDYETFINAAFFLQGEADQFTQQNPSDRKRILSQILNLGIWEGYRKKAFQSRRNIESEISHMDGRTTEIRLELEQEEARREQLAYLEQQLEAAEDLRKKQNKTLDEILKYQALLTEIANKANELDLQVDKKEKALEELRTRLIPRTKEQEACYQTLDQEEKVREELSKWEKAKKSLSELDKNAQKFLEDERQRQEPLSSIATEKARIEQEIASLAQRESTLSDLLFKLPSLEKDIKEKQEAIASFEANLKARDEKQTEQEGALARLSDAKAENPRLLQEMKELEKRIGDLESSDGADCPLCGQPMPAKERESLIKDLKTQGKEMGDRYRENKALLEESDQKVKGLKKLIAELSQSEKALRNQTQELDRLSLDLSQMESKQEKWENEDGPRLKELQDQLATKGYAKKAHQKLEKIDKELKAIGYDPEEHNQIRKSVEAGEDLQEKLQEIEKARAALVPLERDIADITDAIESERTQLDALVKEQKHCSQELDELVKDAPDLSKAEKELLELKEKENILQRQVGAAQQKVSVLESQKERLEELDTKLGTNREKVRLHKQLEEAFGKNGVPALLIEQALPMIELKANEILDRLSGGAMSIRFITQREYKDKKRVDLKETLDIQIQDRAGVRDYEMFSGGESFRINFAIRLALSHVLAQRAGARLQTLVIDEGFGSQDEIGRQRLTEAIALVQDDYKKILVITHIDALKDIFDTQLHVEKTPEGTAVLLK